MQHTNTARFIMDDFATAMGLSENFFGPSRYLCTDAFAVCNFLELYRQTNDASYLNIALRLVDAVHFVLGRYADEDSRDGWISGLDERAGYDHPTIGGLRIGKKLVERKPNELFDDNLEWNRDGQYFHYLTKWMLALNRITAVTGDDYYQRCALELAKTAHAAFTYTTVAGRPRCMHWKMSVDLSRPLISSMGHHDPLDALVTYIELRETSARYSSHFGNISLTTEIEDCLAMCAGKVWTTPDPLGIGNLLVNAFRLAQLKVESDIALPVDLAALLRQCEAGLEAYLDSGLLNHPAQQRLAFRELGLSTGLHALASLNSLVKQYPSKFSLSAESRGRLARLNAFRYLSNVIERFCAASGAPGMR